MTATPSLRVNPENLNHHLWNNNGTWFVHYVVHPTPYTKERIRHSLRTKSVEEARARRDALLESLHAGLVADDVVAASKNLVATAVAPLAKRTFEPSLTSPAFSQGTSPGDQTPSSLHPQRDAS